MLSFFQRNPARQLEKKRQKLLQEAMLTQRSGDLKAYAQLMVTIDKIEKEIESLQSGDR